MARRAPPAGTPDARPVARGHLLTPTTTRAQSVAQGTQCCVIDNLHRPRRRPRSVRDPHAHPVQPDLHAARPVLHRRGVLRRRSRSRSSRRMWFCAARSSDLAGPGVLPDGAGRPRERPASPATAGARSGPSSTSAATAAPGCAPRSPARSQRAFQCPYHAWTYDLDGKLIAAPNLTKMPDIDRVEYGLRTIAVREWLGYVWVCLADEPPSFEDTVMQEVVDRLGDVESIDHYDRRRPRPSAAGSSTTSRPTGSSSSRTSWSATTARPSTPS